MISEAMIGPAVSAAIVASVSWIAVRVSVAKLEQRFADQSEEYRRRFETIERRIGLANGGGTNPGYYVPYRECLLMEGAVKKELETISRRLERLEKQVSGLKEGQ